MKLIDQQIIEAATWIEKVNPHFDKFFFRSPEIKPQGALLPNAGYGKLCLANFASTITQRRKILGDLGVEYLTAQEVMAKGLLVFCCSQQTEHDGGAELYSQGFFDMDDLPPWDTWVAVGDERLFLLVSWVPNDLIPLVYSGKAVCIRDDIIFWGSEVDNLHKDTPLAEVVCREPKNCTVVEVADEKKVFANLEIINRHRVLYDY